MVNGIFWKVLSSESQDECYPDPTGQHLSHTTIHILTALSTPPLEFPCTNLGTKQGHASGVSMWTRWMKHADILQGRQKKCPLEQWQQSTGQRRRRGWPWQITNKWMDKTSLARQKATWKSTVSRKSRGTQYSSHFIVLLFLLSSSSK